jgi:hypothetical protein
MTRSRRIAATVVIAATATLGVAGVASASDYRHGHGGGHDGRYSHNQYSHNHHDRRYNDRGLVGEVLHLVGNLL